MLYKIVFISVLAFSITAEPTATVPEADTTAAAAGTTGSCPADFDIEGCIRMKNLGYCKTNPKLMARYCSPTCGFCGTPPQPPTEAPATPGTGIPPTTSIDPRCTVANCEVMPGLYNYKNCPSECPDITCTNTSISFTGPQCESMAGQGWCGAYLWRYCPVECKRSC